MTTTEKAIMTRNINKEKREQKAQLEQRAHAAIVKGCLLAIESDQCSPEQKFEAAKILNDVRKENYGKILRRSDMCISD